MTPLKTNRYVLAILDQENARGQCGLIFLDSVHGMESIIRMFGLSPRLKRGLGDRWEIHVSLMPAGVSHKKQYLNNISGVILKLIKKLEVLAKETGTPTPDKLGLTPDGAVDWKEYGSKTVNIPANIPAKDTT